MAHGCVHRYFCRAIHRRWFFQHAAKQHPAATATATTGNAVSGYMSVLVSEWLLVLYVRMGVHKRGARLRDLVGGRWATPKDVMKDVALGAGLWAVWIGLMNAHVLGGGANAAQGLLPQGILESLAWLPLALSAGFCEELAFRAVRRPLRGARSVAEKSEAGDDNARVVRYFWGNHFPRSVENLCFVRCCGLLPSLVT